MSRGVNKHTIIGNLADAPELKTFSNGGSVANARIATSSSYKDKDGNKQEATEWHNVVFHNKLAEIAAEHLKKGARVYIEGPSRTRKWQDKDGQDRYTTEVHVDDLEMLDSPKD